jgi:hypothetical protein
MGAQDYPFPLVVEHLKVARDKSHTPVFQVRPERNNDRERCD